MPTSYEVKLSWRILAHHCADTRFAFLCRHWGTRPRRIAMCLRSGRRRVPVHLAGSRSMGAGAGVKMMMSRSSQVAAPAWLSAQSASGCFVRYHTTPAYRHRFHSPPVGSASTDATQRHLTHITNHVCLPKCLMQSFGALSKATTPILLFAPHPLHTLAI